MATCKEPECDYETVNGKVCKVHYIIYKEEYERLSFLQEAASKSQRSVKKGEIAKYISKNNNNIITIKNLKNEYDISYNTASSYLKEMKNEGLLEKVNDGEYKPILE